MVEQAGASASAFAATQDGLVARRGALADADVVLAAVLSDAHAVTADAVQRLDAIEAELDAAVAQQDMLALDTLAGSREFQKFLLAKQQQILAVVNDAVASADAKVRDVRRLQQQYRLETGA